MVKTTKCLKVFVVYEWFVCYLLRSHYKPILDKTIKLWKIHEKSASVVSESNLGQSNGFQHMQFTQSNLKLPKITHHDTTTISTPRKIYQNAHTYHIHSLSVNPDGETFISSDDLRVNLWNLGISDQSFSTSHLDILLIYLPHPAL